MKKETSIKLFEQKQIRSVWNDDEEKWCFSIVDVIAILTEQQAFQGARNYWKVLKNRLLKEGNETVTNCNRLKLVAEDGKMRFTDVADTEQLFRLIQSVPSKKAEPFKLWLARVGKERIDEIEDPEIGIDRLMETYLRKGYTKEWINQRLKSIEAGEKLDVNGISENINDSLETGFFDNGFYFNSFEELMVGFKSEMQGLEYQKMNVDTKKITVLSKN